ncbi:MAG: recombinase RecT [Thermoplasmata archaeon]|nr:recombinase RecT [Thermoplasmata archaeon]
MNQSESLSVNQPKSIQQLIEASAAELGRALPEHMRPERLVRIALTCIRQNPVLAECTSASFLGALFTAAQLGLEPVAGRAYLLPFNNKRKIGNEWKSIKEVQFVIGYKGVAELFFRHSKAIALRWGIVREGDDFDYEEGTKEFLRHKAAKSKRGAVVGYWVLAQIQGGGTPFKYMSVEECMEHGRKHSKTFSKTDQKFSSSSPWATEPDSMCLKTVLLQLSKLLPLSVEVQRALEADESAREFKKEIESALDIPSTTNWHEPEEIVAHVDIIDEPPAQSTVEAKQTPPEASLEQQTAVKQSAQPAGDPGKLTLIETLEMGLEEAKKEGTKAAVDLWWARNEAQIKAELNQKERNSIRASMVMAKAKLQ